MNESPQLTNGVRLNLKGTDFTNCRELRVSVTDWNNNGKKDIVVGNLYFKAEVSGASGNIWLFLGE